ncbi:MAG: M20/M25/M40 family metallo-hydrolase [Thermodesulfovibrionales bacterium]|nr:M20/M25/M40 family metallo-hydrolase [Thermodesulfovibrionales bacterium]
MTDRPIINKNRLINHFIGLIKINSPSFSEKEICNHIVRLLKRCGCKTFIQDYGQSINLICKKEGNDKEIPPLILNAHMDTVQSTDGLMYKIDDEKIMSVGRTVIGADDKSAIAQIIEAIMVIDENKIRHGDIEIVLTSAEEKGLVGAKNLDFSHIKGQFALVIDSSGHVGKIIVGAPTHLTYELTIKGKSAHAGIEPEKGVNAIKVAADIITKISDGRIDNMTTANIGYIHGGVATNVVPSEVKISGEIRSHHRDTLQNKRDTLVNLVSEVCKKSCADYEFQETIQYESFYIDKDDVFLSFVKSAYEILGFTAQLEISGGGSDANIFNSRGIKAINISNGMQAVHTNEEFIMIDDLIKGSMVIVEVIKKMGDIKR